MTEYSSQSQTESDSDEGPEPDVEQARTRDSSDDLTSNEWLSLHGFPTGTEDELVAIFSRFCSMNSHRKRKNGLELGFASAEHLQLGVLMAKRLVVCNMQIQWHVGRLEVDPSLNPKPSREEARASGGGLGVFGKLRRAFANYFH
ncbi:uncharacterized protein LOC27206348 [Drosophila simulans]|uniref:GD15894 n=1 Tax=Drosophila simulans TaxID=7240 RepID=B4R4A4_DROSI|nr:uncharacterized protein LOC27206348 [Drosophila simulans]XP_044779735.1 uncharacterized protein LOC27206348 [Drosophila simulans]EDX17806.1 GD15894 [Drosophila simulans]KMZ09566.1 uncharacterized protein Dsimw501_GD15894 [Drosophila simulans]